MEAQSPLCPSGEKAKGRCRACEAGPVPRDSQDSDRKCFVSSSGMCILWLTPGGQSQGVPGRATVNTGVCVQCEGKAAEDRGMAG